MHKEKISNIVGFTGLVLYALGFIVFVIYKLTYASFYNLSPVLMERFADKVILCQSIVLELVCIGLIKDLADGKKWYNQALIYIFAFVIICGVTGGIMGLVDLISGRPYSIL